jgi:hypothetical protein
MLAGIVHGVQYPLVVTLVCCWAMLVAFAVYRHFKKIL